jgi:DnaK suppressor protein
MDPNPSETRLLLHSRRHALERSGAAVAEHGVAEIHEIDAALARLDDGSYGSCERCGGAIGRHRLRALPEVRFCASCT